MSVEEQTKAIRSTAGASIRSEVRTLRLAGPDRVRFLNGMVTSDVAKLERGQGVLAMKTNNRGRIEGFMRVRATDDAFEMELLEVVADKVRTTLDMFIIMDDCTIEDASKGVVTVLGPKAEDIVKAAGWPVPSSAHGFAAVDDVTVISDRTLGIPGFEIHGDDADALLAKLVESGATRVGKEAFELVRIESGVPIDGPDLDDDTIPMEARLEHAIDFKKGCYVGQEVIARATNLGQVNHLLIGLKLSGQGQPTDAADVLDPSSGKSIGEVTSVVESPSEGLIALGYTRRKYADSGTELQIKEGDVTWTGTVVELPFVSPESA